MGVSPAKIEESANQPEGCDAKLQGPERAASCTFQNRTAQRGIHHSKRFNKVQDAERCTSQTAEYGTLSFCGRRAVLVGISL